MRRLQLPLGRLLLLLLALLRSLRNSELKVTRARSLALARLGPIGVHDFPRWRLNGTNNHFRFVIEIDVVELAALAENDVVLLVGVSDALVLGLEDLEANATGAVLGGTQLGVVSLTEGPRAIWTLGPRTRGGGGRSRCFALTTHRS